MGTELQSMLLDGEEAKCNLRAEEKKMPAGKNRMKQVYSQQLNCVKDGASPELKGYLLTSRFLEPPLIQGHSSELPTFLKPGWLVIFFWVPLRVYSY